MEENLFNRNCFRSVVVSGNLSEFTAISAKYFLIHCFSLYSNHSKDTGISNTIKNSRDFINGISD